VSIPSRQRLSDGLSPPALAALAAFVALGAACGPACAQGTDPPASAARETAAREAAAETRFEVLEYLVVGNTTLDVESIERAVMPFLGPQRTMTDVEGARAALERAYQQRGFLSVAVDVPQQQVVDGVVRLDVVEGRVGRLRVRGARWYSLGAIRDAVPAAAEGAVPQFAEVERQVAAASRGDLLSITPSLKPGRTPGTLDIDLSVEDRSPIVATAELNNYRAANTDPLRLLVGLRHLDLWDRRHIGSLGLIVSPQDLEQVRVLTASYAWPLGGPDDPTLSAYVLDSDSDTPTAIGGTTVFGGQTVVGLRRTAPLQPRLGLYHSWTVGIDWKRLVQQDFPTLQYMPIQLAYSAVRPTRTATTQFDASLNLSMRGLGNDEEAFRARRYLGSASYASMRVDASHEGRIGADWSLRLRLAGQYAQQALVPAEQYALGGASSVRGYLESSVFGDRGLLGSLELRGPNWKPVGSSPLTAQWIVFYDYGHASIVDPLPEQRASVSLAGAGAGVRVRHGRQLSSSVELAKTLRPLPTQDDAWRAYVRIALEL
jgi:hemolysin activation/secretion protein